MKILFYTNKKIINERSSESNLNSINMDFSGAGLSFSHLISPKNPLDIKIIKKKKIPGKYEVIYSNNFALKKLGKKSWIECAIYAYSKIKLL